MSKAISHILRPWCSHLCGNAVVRGWVKETVGKRRKDSRETAGKSYEDNQDIVPAGPPPALAQYELPPFSFAPRG